MNNGLIETNVGRTSPALRRRLKRYWRIRDRIFEAWMKDETEINYPQFPPYPEECKNMICGAKNREGMPCKINYIYGNGRCRFHGGLSTGPKTTEGKKRASLNGLRPKRKQSP